jgi:hypothetical protein
MEQRHKYTLAVILAISAMVVILPLLAYLQYTWLGQLSEQEYHQMQENVRTAAFHCSMDFSQGMTELMKSVGSAVKGSDDDAKKEIVGRLKKWKMTAIHRAIASDSVVISSIPSTENAMFVKVDDESSLLLFKDLSKIAVPIQGKPSRYVCIPLDLNYISTTLLPEIVRSNFSSNVRAGYDIVVVDNNKSKFFVLSETKSQIDTENADVVIPFLMLPPGPLSMVPTRPARDQMYKNREGRGDPNGRFTQETDRRKEHGPPRDMRPPERGGPKSEWRGIYEIRIKHHYGSLEAAVNINRWRNLGVSVGVLLLLASSVVFLVISANRAQRLTRQQLSF